MTNALPGGEPNPVLVFGLMNAHQKSSALRAAVDLRVFSVIGGGARTSKEIAERCAASERGIRILCDFLTIEGLLAKEGNEYALTPTSATFLDERSPASMSGMIQFLHGPKMMVGFADLTETVRKGSRASEDSGIAGDEIEEWVTFAKVMTPTARVNSQLVAEVAVRDGVQPKRVLDIAAGHGLYGIGVALAAREAEITAVDWPKVLAVAEENAKAAGVSERYRLMPGSAFTADLGTGFDLILLTNFLHHFDWAVCVDFLKKLYAALAPGGRLLTIEFAPNDDRVTPPATASFSLIMLANTPAGDAYTKTELAEMMREAGFASSEVMDIPRSVQQLIVANK